MFIYPQEYSRTNLTRQKPVVCLVHHFYESIRVQQHDDNDAHQPQWLGNLYFVCRSSSWLWIVSLEINPRKSLPVPMKRSVQPDRSFLCLQDIYDQYSLHDFAPMAQKFLLFCKRIVMEIVLSPSVEGALEPASINGNRKPSRRHPSMHETFQRPVQITPHNQIPALATDDAHPDSIDHLDELGNTARSSRTTDALGNTTRDSRHDSSPDDRRDPDFGYGGGGRGNSDLF